MMRGPGAVEAEAEVTKTTIKDRAVEAAAGVEADTTGDVSKLLQQVLRLRLQALVGGLKHLPAHSISNRGCRCLGRKGTMLGNMNKTQCMNRSTIRVLMFAGLQAAAVAAPALLQRSGGETLCLMTLQP